MTETVLVEPFVRSRVPETAGVRTDFVHQHYLSIGIPSELEFEIDELDIQRSEQLQEQSVDFCRHVIYVLEIFESYNSERYRLSIIDKRVPQLGVVVIQIIYDRGWFGTFLYSKPVGKRTGDVIAYDHLERDILALATELFPVIESGNVVGIYAVLFEILEDKSGDFVVHYTLLREHCRLDIVERSGHILEVEHHYARIIGSIDPFLVAVK